MKEILIPPLTCIYLNRLSSLGGCPFPFKGKGASRSQAEPDLLPCATATAI